MQEVKDKIIEKGASKDWNEREVALKQLKDNFLKGRSMTLDDMQRSSGKNSTSQRTK